MRAIFAILGFLTLASLTTDPAQDRETKVVNDRSKIADLGGWIYNDLAAAQKAAHAANKPILVVFRCIPCEACQEFDDDVARRDPIIRDLLDKFVCVRIVQCNDLDLTKFQHDFDQSFAITMMHADGTILGRFGTRSNHDDEAQDITLEGLRETLDAALVHHATIATSRPFLTGKNVRQARLPTPLDYPSLKGKHRRTLSDAEGQVARSCVHCHQVGEAERRFFRDAMKPIPDEVLYPYPNPRVLGLEMDAKHMNTVASVAGGGVAARAGFRSGDRIMMLDDQAILSTADIQWVLHHASDGARLRAEVERGGSPVDLTLSLDPGWRRRGDISWRATTWDLRRMALGGMKLAPLSAQRRRELDIADQKMALIAEHVGEYDDHAVAKNAGLRAGDIVIAFDGRTDLMTESAAIAHGVQNRAPGDPVVVTYLRDGEKRQATIKLQ